MAHLTQLTEITALRYSILKPHLGKRQRRLFLGVEASDLGRGGQKAIALATGVHPDKPR